MTKIIELSDIHSSISWIKKTKEDIKTICEVGKKEKVDAILVSGDFFHRPVIASIKNHWDEFLQLARDLKKIAQVYYIVGTPTHEDSGCYESFKDIGWKEINIGQHHYHNDLLIMGIPEIKPNNINAKFPKLSKSEIVEKQYDLVDGLIEDYYKPICLDHSGPSIFLLHGHVSGAKFRDDQKPRTSDFMFSEKMLKDIGASRYQAGHIHLPQKFKTINGGYVGSVHTTNNEINFVPGFNVVTFDNGEVNEQRFYFNTPERRKLKIDNIEDLNKIDQTYNDTRLWIDIECDKEFAFSFDCEKSINELIEKYNLAAGSKITTSIKHEQKTRINSDEYEKCQTIEELVKIFDPNIKKSVIKKVNESEIETEMNIESNKKHNFEILDLYIKGSKAGLENGIEEIYIDFSNFNNGVNLLTGKNGTGKSFTLGFLSPFSKHIPSGLDLKSLFSLKDSQIIRRWKDNDSIITQKILIDPTLASPSAKYFMDIDGKSCEGLTGNKTPFDKKVTEIFGSLKMFLACAFRGQKDSSECPSLENAKESDLREIFTELSGLDRKPLKDYAHNKVYQLKRDNELDIREKETLVNMKEDINLLKNSIDLRNESIIDSNKDIEIKEYKLEGFNKGVEELKGFKNSYNSKELELSKLNSQYFETVSKWQADKNKIDLQLKYIEDSAIIIKDEISNHQSVINKYNADNETKKIEIGYLNKPCEHCSKLSSEAESKINDLDKQIQDNIKFSIHSNNKLSKLTEDLNERKITYKTLRDSISKKPDEPKEIDLIRKELESIKNSPEYKESELKLNSLNLSIESTNREISRIEKDIIILNSEIDSLKKDIKKQELNNVKIEEIELKVNSSIVDISEWEEIEKIFSPKGLPAMELSLIAPIIEKKANDILSTYNTRYRVEIITQDYDATGKRLIERFKILVHDSKSTDVKNLPIISGGQSAWVTRALREALSSVASSKSGRSWLYGIEDESDGAIDTFDIPLFYEMIEKSMDKNKKIICVSHSSEAREYISNQFDITSFFKDYE